MTLQVDGDESTGWKIGQPKAFLATTSNASEPRLSPDGNWIAYQSSHGTTTDVHVRPFPGPGGVRMILQPAEGSQCGRHQAVVRFSLRAGVDVEHQPLKNSEVCARIASSRRDFRSVSSVLTVFVQRFGRSRRARADFARCSLGVGLNRPVFVGFNASFRARGFKNLAG